MPYKVEMTAKEAADWIRTHTPVTVGRWLHAIDKLCYGDNPDAGEPVPMLEWNTSLEGEGHPADVFRDAMDKCLIWNA